MSLEPSRNKATEDFKVVVFSAQGYVQEFLMEGLTDIFPKAKMFDVLLTTDTAALAKGSDAVVAFVNDDLSKKTLETLKDCGVKLVALRCAGFDRVDLDAAVELGITVCNVPRYSPQSIAEHAAALLLNLTRNITTAQKRMQVGNFTLSGLVGREIKGLTVGVWGTGAIGGQFIKIMTGFQCRILAYDPNAREDLVALGVEYVDLPTLLKESDVLSLHCPSTKETYKIINKDTLGQMKTTAVIINTSRGSLIDSDDLIDALENGTIAGAGLDVYENEDQLYFLDRSAMSIQSRMKQWDRKMANLMTLPNVIITPHTAFLTQEALDSISDQLIQNIYEYANNQTCKNCVKKR